jgi:polygalacturonase
MHHVKRVWLFLLPVAFYCLACSHSHIAGKTIAVEAPFKMPELQVNVFPNRLYNIQQYGAVEGGNTINTALIDSLIKLCHQAGGGTVLVPAGKWLTGKIHLLSNIRLHIAENAELIFSDEFADYLPAVQSSWEGMECYNYSPLIYAINQQNITLSGPGKLYAKVAKWAPWYERPPAHLEGLKTLYAMSAAKLPVEQRQMATNDYNFRPQFIQFNRCKNIVIENLRIVNSPFWTVHLYLCDGVIVRGLNIWAHGHNNDGIDPEMTKNLLIEHCVFDQGDDAIAIKAGRDHDGWRLNQATEHIVIRNCTIKDGHQMVAIGSEISAGIKDVYIHHCTAESKNETALNNIIFLKTNNGRGGFIENIYVDHIKAGKVLGSVMGIATDVFYQWKTLVPVPDKKISVIRNIHMSQIEVDEVKMPFDLSGDAELPIQNVSVKDIFIKKAANKESSIQQVINYTAENIKVDQ